VVVGFAIALPTLRSLGANFTQRRAFELAIIQSASEFQIPHLRYQSIIIILGGNIY
jgi:hypothetical protein